MLTPPNQRVYRNPMGERVEHRQFPRYKAKTLVTMTMMDGQTHQRNIINISGGGCLVSPPVLESAHAGGILTFQVGETHVPIRADGEIVYTNYDRGTGIAFTQISEPSRKFIDSFFSRVEY